MSQDARDAFFSAAQTAINTQAQYVSDAGDTMTGTLTGVGIVETSPTATTEAAIVSKGAIGGATVAPVRMIQSTASGAFMSFSGAFLSSASYAIGGRVAFVIPVYHESQRIWGYLGATTAL